VKKALDPQTPPAPRPKPIRARAQRVKFHAQGREGAPVELLCDGAGAYRSYEGSPTNPAFMWLTMKLGTTVEGSFFVTLSVAEDFANAVLAKVAELRTRPASDDWKTCSFPKCVRAPLVNSARCYAHSPDDPGGGTCAYPGGCVRAPAPGSTRCSEHPRHEDEAPGGGA
jgi:hypothetical protein